MLTIAVDAMGGDHAPKAEVEGAIRAARTLDVRVILVGSEEVVRKELGQHADVGGLPIEIRHASERITMEDSAAKAVRTKRDSSIRIASRLEGRTTLYPVEPTQARNQISASVLRPRSKTRLASDARAVTRRLTAQTLHLRIRAIHISRRR